MSVFVCVGMYVCMYVCMYAHVCSVPQKRLKHAIARRCLGCLVFSHIKMRVNDLNVILQPVLSH
jgi:hypothetical protein